MSKLRLAAAMDHTVEGSDSIAFRSYSAPDLGRLTVATRLEPGHPMRMVKFVTYGWSSERSVPALRDQA